MSVYRLCQINGHHYPYDSVLISEKHLRHLNHLFRLKYLNYSFLEIQAPEEDFPLVRNFWQSENNLLKCLFCCVCHF